MNIERTPCNHVAFNSVLDTNASASLFLDEGQMIAKEDKDKTTGETERFINLEKQKEKRREKFTHQEHRWKKQRSSRRFRSVCWSHSFSMIEYANTCHYTFYRHVHLDAMKQLMRCNVLYTLLGHMRCRWCDILFLSFSFSIYITWYGLFRCFWGLVASCCVDVIL